MKRFLLSALSAALLAQPLQVSAQQPYLYPGIPGATEYLNFLSGSGVNGGYGVQVGPYKAAFGMGVTAPAFSIYCVDYTHYAKDQDVNVTGLGPVGNLANTRIKNYVTYQQAAYLSSLFDTESTASWGGIHAAIWSLTSGVTVGNSTDRNHYLGLAAANAGKFSTAGWYVLTPTNPTYASSGQEFLMRSVVVTEPAAFLLLASGLLLLAAVGRKRLHGLREEDA